jgi:hypothetical protein
VNQEPVAIVNGLIAIVEASIAVGVGFGLDWDAKQVALVMAAVVTVGNLAKTLLVRSQVTPVTLPRNNEGLSLVPKQQL